MLSAIAINPQGCGNCLTKGSGFFSCQTRPSTSIRFDGGTTFALTQPFLAEPKFDPTGSGSTDCELMWKEPQHLIDRTGMAR